MRMGLNHDVLLSHFVHFSLISLKETIIIQRYVFVTIENMTPWIVNEEGGRGSFIMLPYCFGSQLVYSAVQHGCLPSNGGVVRAGRIQNNRLMYIWNSSTIS